MDDDAAIKDKYSLSTLGQMMPREEFLFEIAVAEDSSHHLCWCNWTNLSPEMLDASVIYCEASCSHFHYCLGWETLTWERASDTVIDMLSEASYLSHDCLTLSRDCYSLMASKAEWATESIQLIHSDWSSSSKFAILCCWTTTHFNCQLFYVAFSGSSTPPLYRWVDSLALIFNRGCYAALQLLMCSHVLRS